jgi:hypothetical protein
MRVRIDFSIYCAECGAFGMVHGDIELVALPPIGAVVNLSMPANRTEWPKIRGYLGQLRIENIMMIPVDLPAEPDRSYVTLMLEDVNLHSVLDGRTLLKYMEEGFGLYGDEFGSEERE